MTSKDFMIWLQGFLDGNDDLTVEGVQFLKNKMKEVIDTPPCDIYPTFPPINIPYVQQGDCPAGGWHEYPENWLCTLPPYCKKCGQQGLSWTITCGSDSANCCLNNQTYSTQIWNCNMQVPIGPVCEVDPSRPCAVNTCCKNIQPGMSYIDFQIPYTKMNMDNFIVTEDAWKAMPNTWAMQSEADRCCGLNDKCLNQPLEIKVEEDSWEDGQKFIEFEVELNDEDRNLLHTDKRYARFKAPIKPVPECFRRNKQGEYMFDFKSGEGYETYKELLERKIKEAGTYKHIKIIP